MSKNVHNQKSSDSRITIRGGKLLPKADWTLIRVLHHYRLLLVVGFAASYYLADGLGFLGSRNFELFKYTHLAYLFTAIVFGYLRRIRKPSLQNQFYLGAYIDIVALATLIYASGGVKSGLAILLVFHIAAISHYITVAYSAFFASITTSMLLSQELYARSVYGTESTSLTQTALVCIVLFGVAIMVSLVKNRQPDASAIDAEQPLSFKQISRLNQQIIQELESGVLFVDKENKVQIINMRAQEWLYGHALDVPVNVGTLSDPLYKALRNWRRDTTCGSRAFVSPVGEKELLPDFVDLGNGGTLIRIEDHQRITDQVQQLKLASLGRISASIAHEIRNPLAAIKNAVQLLEESPKLTEEDLRLIDIANLQADRINQIVQDVMQLSSRQSINSSLIELAPHLENFQQEFSAHHHLEPQDLQIDVASGLSIWFDASHLDRVLWNLCSNSLIHNPDIPVQIHLAAYRRDDGSVILDIEDNGHGITSEQQQWMFEPFYTTRHQGTGLGLFIIRELCELNHSHITYLGSEYGACFRIALPMEKRMAA